MYFVDMENPKCLGTLKQSDLAIYGVLQLQGCSSCVLQLSLSQVQLAQGWYLVKAKGNTGPPAS